MKFTKTKLDGVFFIESDVFTDKRGEFQKLFQKSTFFRENINITIDELFLSTSNRGVIRGMHFQNPPNAQSKLVYVLQGRVLDVLVDIRKNSPTFKQFITFELNSTVRNILYIPIGIAHGFQSLENNTIMAYAQSNEFNSDADNGINPLSCGIEWPIMNETVVSDKDILRESLKNFITPFN